MEGDEELGEQDVKKRNDRIGDNGMGKREWWRNRG